MCIYNVYLDQKQTATRARSSHVRCETGKHMFPNKQQQRTESVSTLSRGFTSRKLIEQVALLETGPRADVSSKDHPPHATLRMHRYQPTPPPALMYTPQKYGFNKALLRETMGNQWLTRP